MNGGRLLPLRRAFRGLRHQRHFIHRVPAAVSSSLLRHRQRLLPFMMALGGGLSAATLLQPANAAPAERRIDDDYVLGEELGAGAYGVVYKAMCKKTGIEVAVKKIQRRRQTEDAVRREVAVLRRVGLHRGVAALLDEYETENDFYLVMEYVKGGELFDALVDAGCFSEARAAAYARQVADAAAFLHAQGLCHADIKPENLLLTSTGEDGVVKLVDFGLTDEVRSASDAKPGTWAYWPPEAFSMSGCAIGKPTDMWSLGCVLFVMLSGYHPFDPTSDADDETLQQRICHGSADFDDPIWDSISQEAKDVIQGLLRRDSSRRLTIEQLLQQPWLRHGGASSAPLVHSETRLRRFRQSTAPLRAAVFATILQQHATQSSSGDGGGRARDSSGGGGSGLFGRRANVAPLRRADSLRRTDSLSGRMLEAEMLGSAFRVFDPEGKG